MICFLSRVCLGIYKCINPGEDKRKPITEQRNNAKNALLRLFKVVIMRWVKELSWLLDRTKVLYEGCSKIIETFP